MSGRRRIGMAGWRIANARSGFSMSWSAIEGGVPVAISRHHTTATAVTKDRNVANVVSRCGLSVRHLWPFLAAVVNASDLTLSFRVLTLSAMDKTGSAVP